MEYEFDPNKSQTPQARAMREHRIRKRQEESQREEDRIEHRLLLDLFRGIGADVFGIDPAKMMGNYDVQSRYAREILTAYVLRDIDTKVEAILSTDLEHRPKKRAAKKAAPKS